MKVFMLVVETIEGIDPPPTYIGLYETVGLAKDRAQEYMEEDGDEAVGDWEESHGGSFSRYTLMTKNDDLEWAREYEITTEEVHGS